MLSVRKLSSNCSQRELKEIEDWVKHYRSVDDLKRKVAAFTLPEQIAAAAEWFKVASPEEAAQIGADILATTIVLRSVLVKRGLT